MPRDPVPSPLAFMNSNESEHRKVNEQTDKLELDLERVCRDLGNAIEDYNEIKRELAESDAVREKLTDILSRIAIVLKGPEKPLTAHGWADLPLLAKALRAELANERAAFRAMAEDSHELDERAHNLERENALLREEITKLREYQGHT